jgi:hypothetical protein
MHVQNALTPNAEQMRGFQEGDTDTPIYMLNLLKFRKKRPTQMGALPIPQAPRLTASILRRLRVMSRR